MSPSRTSIEETATSVQLNWPSARLRTGGWISSKRATSCREDFWVSGASLLQISSYWARSMPLAPKEMRSSGNILSLARSVFPRFRLDTVSIVLQIGAMYRCLKANRLNSD